jgi:hypothetical protein
MHCGRARRCTVRLLIILSLSVRPTCISCCVLPAQTRIVRMLTHRLVFAAAQIIRNGHFLADFFAATARTPTRSGHEPTQLSNAALGAIAVNKAGRTAYMAPHESKRQPGSAPPRIMQPTIRTSEVRHCISQSMSRDDMSGDDLSGGDLARRY